MTIAIGQKGHGSVVYVLTVGLWCSVDMVNMGGVGGGRVCG